MVVCVRRFFSKYFTLTIWRWGFQAIACALVTSLLVVIPSMNALFHGSGYWAVSSAVVVLEGTTGASLKKSLERLAGTFIGGISAWGLFSLATWNESLAHTTYARIALWVIVCLFPFPWGYVRNKFPRNPLISVYGVMTGYIVMLSAYLKNDVFFLAVLRTAAVGTGVLVAGIVVHIVFPKRARVEVKKGLADVLQSIADILEPLLDIAAGLTPTETLTVLQPVKNKLKEIAIQKYLLHEKRDRHLLKRGDSVLSQSAGVLRDTSPFPVKFAADSRPPSGINNALPSNEPIAGAEKEEQRQSSRVGNFVRKLSASLTNLFKPDVATGDQHQGTGGQNNRSSESSQLACTSRREMIMPDNEYEHAILQSKSQLPTLSFRGDPTTQTEPPFVSSALPPPETQYSDGPPYVDDLSSKPSQSSALPSIRDPPLQQRAADYGKPDLAGQSDIQELHASNHAPSAIPTDNLTGMSPSTGDTLSDSCQDSQFRPHYQSDKLHANSESVSACGGQPQYPLAGDPSAVSTTSTFYRDKSLDLDILRAKTLKDVAAELMVSFQLEETQRSERWKRTMDQFEKCQKLLSAQSALLVEARQEISVRGPTVFPSEKYQAALTHIQALFHHITSLFFSLDLQLAQVAQARRHSYAVLHKTEFKQPELFPRVAFLPFEDLHVSEDPEVQRKVYAGMTAALENTEVFGHIIAEAVINIRDALKGLAASVLSSGSVEGPLAYIDTAAKAITVLNDLRKQRSQIISKVFTTAMMSEQMGRWVLSSPVSPQFDGDNQQSNTTSLPWETLMGVEPHVFQEMTRQERREF